VNDQPLGEANPRWLQDDYVKFIRLTEHLIEVTGTGMVGWITNHSFLDNVTFRGARQHLLRTFRQAAFFDLHGNTKKKERSPDGSVDVNVFEIQQGVAITFLARPQGSGPTLVRHSDLFGTREAKYAALTIGSVGSTPWHQIKPVSPFFLFIPQDQTLYAEYDQFVKLTDAMPVHSNGVVTARDHFCIAWSEREAWDTVRAFAEMKPEEARKKFELGDDSRDWQVKLAQADVRKDGPSRDCILPIYYRPFDLRWTYYTGRSRGYLCMPRGETMRNMRGGSNVALITSRMTKGETFQHVQASRAISEAIVMSPKTSNNGFLFPLFLLPEGPELHRLTLRTEPEANFSPYFRRTVSEALGLNTSKRDGDGGEPSPEDIFHYIYAVLHSPDYRSRYAGFLKMDFPRLPLTRDLGLFGALVGIGGELVGLHLLESPRLDKSITEFIRGRTREVEKISWSRDTVWVDKPQTTGFRGVSEAVWSFHIGGYQVCEKWLKDRKGRTLSNGEIAHYQKIVVAVHETIRLMKEIDEAIADHGGWPAAFDRTGDYQLIEPSIKKVAESAIPPYEAPSPG
jgi:predicted helicase